MSEKNEKATTYKLKKAKEQGKVSKSAELTTCIFLLITTTVASALWPSVQAQTKQLVMHLVYLITRMTFSIDTIIQLHHFVLLKITLLWLPFALAGTLAIILPTIAQTGFVWSGKPVAPDFKRLNIANGVKRLFSLTILFDACKNSLKLGLFFLLVSFIIRRELPTILTFVKTTPFNVTSLLLILLLKIVLQLSILLLAFALIDKRYTLWKFAKDQRMSKQELKEEYRQREGDPKIKAKIRQLQYQQRQKTTSLSQIKTADVIITNPTHLAIALKYERGLMPAPKVVCKAQGELVNQVKLLAARHGIPIVENKPLARMLFATSDLNQWVDRAHFPMVAMIFRDIYQQKAMYDVKIIG